MENFPAPVQLTGVETLMVPGYSTEDVLVGPNGQVFTGLEDGRILEIANDGAIKVVANTHGRPLGVELFGAGKLLVCDAILGLLTVDIASGETDILVDEIGGKPLTFCNNAAVDNMVLNMKDMFDLTMAYAIDGYTQEVAQQIMAIQVKAATSGQQADPMMYLPVLSKIKLETVKINLKDKSLLGRVLDFQAQQMGTTGDQLAQGAPMMIGMGMAFLQMPELTSMVTKAVGKFLTDKGTLFIDATPDKPVPLMDLVINGQANPQVIPGMLNLKITAQ